MFEEQDINNIKTQKKIFLFFCVFLFIVLLISFVLIIYVLIHHQAITTNENKIEKIHKNILNLENQILL
ncbi:hypothetical protein ['Prunus avium' virescence phytoplasma]|uniref:hypothetical protein n=1 Tax='Prunus avium' virescence phytoplasma TaxID=2056121 RepID=UPI003D80982D